MVKTARPRKRSAAAGMRRSTASGSATLSTLGVGKSTNAHRSPTATPRMPEERL